MSTRNIPGVYKDRKRGSWFFTADAPGPDGTRRQVRRRGFATQREASDARDAFRAQVAAGHVPVPDDDTVRAFANAWIAALPAEGVEPATVKHYSECLARLSPIGDIPIQALTALDLDRAYAVLLDAGRSARTVRASHVAMRKMLNEAVRVGKVAVNVAADARPPRARAARAKQFTTWSYDETVKVLGAVVEHEDGVLWHVAGFTGMRRGELVALQWVDVDLDDAKIVVSRSVGKGLDGALHDKRPKSDAGKRTVELDEPLVALLRAHRKAQRERRLALGPGWKETGLVFCEVDGSSIHPDRLSKRWSDLMRRHAARVGVPAIRLHDLRHSHATQLLDAEVRPDIVSERLGHASVAFTLSTYAHRYAGDQRSGLARLRSAAR